MSNKDCTLLNSLRDDHDGEEDEEEVGIKEKEEDAAEDDMAA